MTTGQKSPLRFTNCLKQKGTRIKMMGRSQYVIDRKMLREMLREILRKRRSEVNLRSSGVLRPAYLAGQNRFSAVKSLFLPRSIPNFV